MYIILICIALIFIICIVLYLYIKNYGYQAGEYINKLFIKNCTDPSVFDPKDFKWTQNFRDNWKNILNEYQKYVNKFYLPPHSNINKIVSSCDTDNKWKTIYLRAFGRDTELIKYFPKTQKLIDSCDCTLAFFSVLEPGAKLQPHKGIYKGVIRYHLGLIIPDKWNDCFINVDNHKLHWKTGEDIMFDDLFTHYVENNTDQRRVILFLDIKRNFRNPILNFINTVMLYFIKSNDALDETILNANNNVFIK
ncbi:MAG: mg19 protein [Edafosvirus sp.]|uniref:Mg19 protein n=1 Tax=Edafosvirus sp. TaxID=2487765 RepID=A0A3G4ZXK2_9VIRU|nr:MAG: mg19 protein [Edafosvirus sp.]